MNARLYSSPAAFRQALDQRLRNAVGGSGNLVRRRQLLVFDRFLARAAAEFGDSIVVKGGVALELRLRHARTTRDIDLGFSGDPSGLLSGLRGVARLDLGDFMSFEVAEDPDAPEIETPGLRYGGRRFRAICSMAGRPYGMPFGVDVSIGEPIHGNVDRSALPDVLAFAGLPAQVVRVIPVATHIAEKLHAYSLPRERVNSRVKDLPDMALLASLGHMESRTLLEAIRLTFDRRLTHAPPLRLPDPPQSWEGPYAAMAVSDSLQWKTIGALTVAVREFLDPVLAGEPKGLWSPGSWGWLPQG